jgi:hypothetical protein
VVDGAVEGLVEGVVGGVVNGLVAVVGAWEVLKGVVTEVEVNWGGVGEWNVWVVGGVVIEIIIVVDAVDRDAELQIDCILFASANALLYCLVGSFFIFIFAETLVPK